VVYHGALAHRDTAGHSGTLGPGDVQWMTAGAGLLHEERHEREFARQGGTLELLQLWVNVPRRDKMAPPRYQNIRAATIPAVPVAEGQGSIRVVAGSYGPATGPAETFSPIMLLDVHLAAGAATTISLPTEYNVGIYVVQGSIVLHGNRPATAKQLVVFGWDSMHVQLTATTDAVVLVLAGQPIEEPLATYGPFVMNTNQELVQAIADFESGGMGAFPENE
jgi:redox-sensitive bicupin YhaK (pirin superfamily)